MQVNSHILRLTGKIEIPAAMEMGKDIRLTITGAVTSIVQKDNDDGTVDMIYNFRGICEGEQ